MRRVRRGKLFSYGGALNAGPGRKTHKGGHRRELRAVKKRARRAARKEFLEEVKDEADCLLKTALFINKSVLRR